MEFQRKILQVYLLKSINPLLLSAQNCMNCQNLDPKIRTE